MKNQTDKQIQYALVALFIVMPLIVLMDVAMLMVDERPPAVTQTLADLKTEQCIHWNHYGLPDGEHGPCPGKVQPRWFVR